MFWTRPSVNAIISKIWTLFSIYRYISVVTVEQKGGRVGRSQIISAFAKVYNYSVDELRLKNVVGYIRRLLNLPAGCCVVVVITLEGNVLIGFGRRKRTEYFEITYYNSSLILQVNSILCPGDNFTLIEKRSKHRFVPEETQWENVHIIRVTISLKVNTTNSSICVDVPERLGYLRIEWINTYTIPYK